MSAAVPDPFLSRCARLTSLDPRALPRSNDDGWLVGGGEGGDSPPWLMPHPDSAHVEVAHIGNGDPEKGGLSETDIRMIMSTLYFQPIRLGDRRDRPSALLLCTHWTPTINTKCSACSLARSRGTVCGRAVWAHPIALLGLRALSHRVLPSRLVTNDDLPWSEMELLFDRDENPDLMAVQEQLRAAYTNRLVSFPPTFHMTITRKLHWRSAALRDQFLAGGNAAIQQWRAANPWGVVLGADPAAFRANDTNIGVTEPELASPGGLYLYWNRNNVKAYFPPAA